MVSSEIVHVISDTPKGPYKFVNVALDRRGIQFWDGKSVHNPKNVKYKNKDATPSSWNIRVETSESYQGPYIGNRRVYIL